MKTRQFLRNFGQFLDSEFFFHPFRTLNGHLEIIMIYLDEEKTK